MPRGGPFIERKPLEQRFWSKVDRTDSCWNWTAFINPAGYGMFEVGSRADNTKRAMLAHRWSYERVNGEIPDGLVIDHLCRNRRCVRPDHMEVVTPVENTKRGDYSDRSARRRNRTHCKHGHEWTPENTHVYRGWRRCRECDRLSHQLVRFPRTLSK